MNYMCIAVYKCLVVCFGDFTNLASREATETWRISGCALLGGGRADCGNVYKHSTSTFGSVAKVLQAQ